LRRGYTGRCDVAADGHGFPSFRLALNTGDCPFSFVTLGFPLIWFEADSRARVPFSSLFLCFVGKPRARSFHLIPPHFPSLPRAVVASEDR